MKANERELVRLNEMVQKRAADLEIYNNHILHSISSGIMTIDNNSRVTTINRSALSLLNSDETSLLGKDYRESLRVYVGLYAILEKFSRGEKFSQVSVNLATRERRNRTVQISISRLKDTAGEDIGTAIILNDQTDYLKIRDELEINRRMAILGEMSGGLAHQLRNSAAAMVGLARLINRKSGEDGVLRDNSELLLKEAMETSELVSRFLDFSRPMHLESREFDVVALIEEIGHSLEGRFRNIYIEYDFKKAHPVTILGDQLLLKQAISNLADNACKALPQSGGKVNFSVWEEDEVVIITIKDNGRGIPDELKDKIFTPFISGSPSGTGLGLALAMKIVSIHGGHITFDSRRDQGTEFFVSLPYAAAGADAAARDKFAATT
jgi:signal transduction histidine kinase